MENKCYLLFSDGTYSTTTKDREYSTLEDAIDNIIKNHWWPFPLDIKGDYRRWVKIIYDVKRIEIRKEI